MINYRQVTEKIEIINGILMKNALCMKSSSLLNGKLGISIYFFQLSRETGDESLMEFAGELVDSVYQDLGNGFKAMDFENGIAGIAWGIEYLERHGFVEANTDEVLSEVDDKIYKYIVSRNEMPSEILNGAMGYILYGLSRIRKNDIQSENQKVYIFKRLLIELINIIGYRIENRKFAMEEPLLFDSFWSLPVCLCLLSKVRSLNIYNSKIDRILDHLSPFVLSLYPRLMSNRVHLLLGMECINQQSQRPNWKFHSEFLKQNIELSDILKVEFKDKSLNFSSGIAGIAWITRRLYRILKDESFLFKNEDLVTKIILSEYWKDLEDDELQKNNLGLFFGLTGIGIELINLTKNKTK